MLLGLDRPTATKFSFYLGVPTLGGAALLDFIKSREILAQIGVVNVAIGAVTSFVVAYFSKCQTTARKLIIPKSILPLTTNLCRKMPAIRWRQQTARAFLSAVKWTQLN
jgi:hypothetical protein